MDKLTLIEHKLESIIQKLHDQNIILSKNTESLITHEKRTDLAERKIELLSLRIDEIKDQEKEQITEVKHQISDLHTELLPVRIHIQSVEKVITIIFKVVIPCFVGILALMYKLGWIEIK